MKKLLRLLSTLSVIVFLIFSSCENINNSKSNAVDTVSKQFVDTSIYTIIEFDTSDTWLFKNVRPTGLTEDEIRVIGTILKKCIETYNPEQQKQFDSISKAHPEYNLNAQNFVIDLSRYKRQYFPVINASGQKEVWVNCFCNARNKDWRKEMLSVDDGGNCYFNVIINLTKKTYYKFIVNGEA